MRRFETSEFAPYLAIWTSTGPTSRTLQAIPTIGIAEVVNRGRLRSLLGGSTLQLSAEKRTLSVYHYWQATEQFISPRFGVTQLLDVCRKSNDSSQ